MPLQQIDLGNAQRLGHLNVARDQVERQVMPRSRTVGGDDPSLRVGVDQVRSRIEAHLGKALPEQILMAPVRRSRAAVQQSRFGQKDRARAPE